MLAVCEYTVASSSLGEKRNVSYNTQQTSCTRLFERRSDLVKMLKPKEAKIGQLLALTMNSMI